MSSNVQIDQTLMDIVRRTYPAILAQSIIGVQPMVPPSSLVYFRTRYDSPFEPKRFPMSNQYYKTFLRMNDRKRAHTEAAFIKAGYHVVKPSSTQQWSDMKDWCRDQFGEYGFIGVSGTFVFENQEHATQFKLVWSE